MLYETQSQLVSFYKLSNNSD